MLPRTGRRSPERLAVLHLTHEVAEWLAPNAESYACAEVLGSASGDLVSAAVRARDQAGGGRDECLLVLGGTLVEHRLLSLPPMPKAESRVVLQRKAAGLLNCELRETLYAAVELARDGESENGGDPRRWNLLAVRRSLLTPLAAGLARARIRSRRLVCGPMARLCDARAQLTDVSAPAIVIDVDLDSVAVSLIHGDRLRMHNRIPGAFHKTPTMALTLVQELRSFDAFCRKSSRGSPVACVVLMGLESERSRLLVGAIRSALGAAQVLAPAEVDSAADGASTLHRRAVLSACRAQGPFELDAPLPSPPHVATVGAVAGCALLLAATLGAVSHERLAREARRLRGVRVELEARAVDLERVRDDNERFDALLSSAVTEAERLARAKGLGVPLEAALGAVLREVDPLTPLSALSFERWDGEGQVSFAAECPRDPLATLRSLKAVQSALESSALFENAWVEPPELLPGSSDDRGASLEYLGGAEWEGKP